ncbi:MAG TPA: hypothetical protein VNW15_06280 [Rhizomicrobium sp.]|jgi:hypothetical protein|nr:hypothetical protein [Rhizomicrobium sp.]
MKHLSNAIFAGIALAASVIQPAAAGVCLNVKSIKSSDISKDGSAITFKMSDGKIYRNELVGKCPDIWFNGFAWQVKADSICDNEPGLVVRESGQICQLGKFTQMTSAPKG